MSDQHTGDEASHDDPHWEAFVDCFPPEAFAGVAEGLGAEPRPKVLSVLRSWLLPEFYLFLFNCPGGEMSREERVRRLEERRDAAVTLLKSGSLSSTMTLEEALAGATPDNRLEAALQGIADQASEKIRRLRSSRGRAGRPRKDAFLQLAADLARVYKRLTGEEAKEPQWKGGSTYGGDFYDFVIAVERCLRDRVPGVRDELPVSSVQSVTG